MQGCCGSAAKYLVFFTNLLVFLAGLLSLGYGIYALASDDSEFSQLFADAFDGDGGDGEEAFAVRKTPEIILVTASAVVVVLTFIGCCGAIRENRFAIFLYFLVLLILSLAAVAGMTLAVSRSLEEMRQPLVRSMDDYGKNPEVTHTWDRMQIEYGCCGVNGYTDWVANSGSFPNRETRALVPRSCCLGAVADFYDDYNGNGDNEVDNGDDYDDDQHNSTAVLQAGSRHYRRPGSSSSLLDDCARRPYDERYSDSTGEGCFLAFVDSYHRNEEVVAAVTTAIILAMVLNLVVIFGFGLCLVPKSAYQQVV